MQSPLAESSVADAHEGEGARVQHVRWVTYAGIATAVYGYTLAHSMRAWLDNETTSTVALTIGTILGQIGFGSSADILGRGRHILCTISGVQLLAFGGVALCCALNSMGGVLMVFIFLLGLGLGGEYPVAASQIVEIVSGPAPCTAAMRLLGGAYLWIGLGQLIAPIILLSCVSLGCGSEKTWSIAFLVGAFLTVASLAFRWIYAKETPSFLNRSTDAWSERGLALLWKSLQPTSRLLFGTCIVTFIFNLTTGGLFLESVLAQAILPKTSEDPSIQEAFSMFVTASLSFPGYLLAPLVARWRRRIWQLGGFLITAIGLLGLAIAAHDVRSSATCIFYAMALSLWPCSVGATAHFVPAEVFPTCLRATCIGISMAAGELGSIVALSALRSLSDATSPQIVVVVLSAACFLGVASTAALTPHYDQRTLLITNSLKPGKDARQKTAEALDRAEPFRPCPRCEVMVERDGGCNVITCSNCNAAWCFICGGLRCKAYDCQGLPGATTTPTIEKLPQIFWPAT